MKRRKPPPIASRKRAKGGEIRARGILDTIYRERFGRSLYEIDSFSRNYGVRPEVWKYDGPRWRE